MTQAAAPAVMADLDIPPAWARSADRILRNRWRKILVLGATDRGKSTYCAFLAARLAHARQRVAFVDADVGQKDIGPPATITLAHVPARRAAPHLQPHAYYFIGSTTPMAHLLPMLAGSKRMLEAAADADFVIVNTTGFVHGAGRVLKAHKIELLRPDVIVALVVADELDSILHAYRHLHIVRLPPSRRVVVKSTAERKQNRESAFRRYFTGASQLKLSLSRTIIQRSLLFTGRSLADPHYTHVERTSEGLVAVGSQVTPTHGVIKILPQGFEKNLLCGVATRRGDCAGLGIIREIVFPRDLIELLTPVPRHAIAVLQLGRMYVTPEGTELGRAHL